jgi:hypothetical protein
MVTWSPNDPDASEDAASAVLTINWGDGTSPTAATSGTPATHVFNSLGTYGERRKRDRSGFGKMENMCMAQEHCDQPAANLFGRPFARYDDCNPSCLATRCCQSTRPKGRPR